jgi:2-oxoglutarate ferredoxin oxidoreductase subunit delta
MAAKGKVVIKSEWCKGCELCVETCSFGVLEMSEDLNKYGNYAVAAHPEKCTGCTLCAVMCPEIVIEVYKEKKVS